MTPELEAIAQRVEELEKQVAHIASLVVAQSDADRAVEARRFVLKGADGQVQAMLSTSDGGPALFLYDHAQTMRVEISVRGGVPRITIFNASEKCSASLALDADGPMLALSDANGNVRAGLGVAAKAPFLALYDGNEKCRVRLGSDVRLGPGLELYDAEGLLRLDALVEDRHGPMLFLRDKATNPRVSMQLLENHSSVSLHDADNKKWMGLGMSTSGEASLFIGQNGPSPELPTIGPSLKLAIQGDKPCLLFGVDNEVVWSAP